MQEAERKRERQEVMRKQLIEANDLQLQLKVRNCINLQHRFILSSIIPRQAQSETAKELSKRVSMTTLSKSNTHSDSAAKKAKSIKLVP